MNDPFSWQLPQFVTEHALPITVALQACVSVIDVMPPHAPAAHVGAPQLRICVPAVSQVPALVCAHVDQAEHMRIPHGIPSVLGSVHAFDVIDAIGEQTPAAHVGIVLVTICMPLVEQGALGMHGDVIVMGVPHDVPSVVRVQLADSIEVLPAQLPPPHTEMVTVRVWVPVCAQRSG